MRAVFFCGNFKAHGKTLAEPGSLKPLRWREQMDRNGWAAIPDVLHAAAGALEEGRSRKRSQRESRIKAFGPQRANAIGKTNFMRRVIAGCIK